MDEDLAPFFSDFADDATLDGAAVRVLMDGGYIEPSSYASTKAAWADIRVSELGSAQLGADLVVQTGAFAASYKVREIRPDRTRLVAKLKLERQ